MVRLPHSWVSITLLQPDPQQSTGNPPPCFPGDEFSPVGCFAPSREENLHFFMGLSKATSGRIHYLNMIISVSMQINWICSCLLGVNAGSGGDIFSPVAFPFPPTRIPSDPTLPGGSAGLAQHTRGSLEEPRMEHGLQAWSCSDPRSSVQVSNLSQEVTSASAELHPPSCHPALLFGAIHKMQRPQKTPRQTSEGGKKGNKAS